MYICLAIVTVTTNNNMLVITLTSSATRDSAHKFINHTSA